MSESQDKLSTALQHWDYGRMLAGKADRIAWLRSEAEYIKGMIHRATRSPVPAQARILQIGAGPCDVIDYWGEGERHAIDPLADEYKKVFAEFRDSAVNYVTGGGECLP
ncbi:MAG: hypothetical protein MUP47_09855, partial [Phycisphaerae bacterium]|nr:hypothetical protein [Phycisphaerae bacterium]